MAPEISGRMGDRVDARADLYGLGALMYRLLAGHAPFHADDALGWVHAHLTLESPALHTVNPQIPQALADIVHCLLHKQADQRYQSAWGLQADLLRCLLALGGQHLATFRLGDRDMVDQLRPVRQLFGCLTQCQAPQAACQKVRSGQKTNLMLTAATGFGKSALVQHSSSQQAMPCACLVRGKVDQLQRNIPYSALIQALDALVQTGSPQTPRWVPDYNAIDPVLLPFAQVLAPSLVTCKRMPAQALPQHIGSSETRLRFFQATQQLLILHSAQGPVVLFLNELQWADWGTLDFLEQGFTQDTVAGHAAQVEAAMRLAHPSDYMPLLQACQQAVAQLALAIQSQWPQSYSNAAMPLTTDVALVMQQLRQLLRNDDAEAAERLDEHRSLLHRALGQRFARLEQAVHGFAFEVALQVVDEYPAWVLA